MTESTPGEINETLADASTEELYEILDLVQRHSTEPDTLGKILRQAEHGKQEMLNRTALLERIVAACHARQLHNFGSSGEHNG